MTDPKPARPFLKWAGGKTQLLGELCSRIPMSIAMPHAVCDCGSQTRYVEPFVGGGAMFFGLHPENALISDCNVELIDCYEAVRDEVESVIEQLERWPVREDEYYSIRAMDPWRMSRRSRAARMIYLNKSCFNGLYRVNRKGDFNSPYGRWPADRLPKTCDAENLRACSQALANTEIRVMHFTELLEHLQGGEFVYMDPPYVPISPTANFTGYTAGGFDGADLQNLLLLCRRMDQVGINWMLTNADLPLVREMWGQFVIDSVRARRNINSAGGKRGKVGELIIRNYVMTDALAALVAQENL